MTPEIAEFLTRLSRLDPAALVRVRPDPAGSGVDLWARVPWNVLVTRSIAGLSGDRTVSAAAWLAHAVDDPSGLPGLDGQWRTGLPPATAVVVETVPTQVLRRLSAAAAATLRDTATGGLGGRAVGARAIRDALLDHVPIVVTHAEMSEIRVPQRVVQAVARMGFLGADDDPTNVQVAGPWVGISTDRGGAWWRAPSEFALRPHRA